MLPGLSRGAHPVGGWAPLPLAECCRADTPLASLRNVSRRRLTTDQPGRFVTPRWLTLILRCDRPVVGLSALRHAPPALGPMTMSTVPGPGIARTRAEAIELSRVRRPGLILADIQLADGSSGLEAVNDLLNSFEVPVIFISAHPERFPAIHGFRRRQSSAILRAQREATQEASNRVAGSTCGLGHA